jgi:hypothetical protein
MQDRPSLCMAASPTTTASSNDAQGEFLARVDFALPEYGIVGEFDGRAKYGRLLKPGTSPGQAVFDEKLREDAIRQQNFQVIRWTWPDLSPSPCGIYCSGWPPSWVSRRLITAASWLWL